ncbi:pseudouridine synthase [Pinibacter aurantiacus]|uniref:Pseudouridine synthase n=1 Tax=Pinibacter aurantiacus TaxID=2851599 RepID=A0A9E2W6H4_9BACT|nr:pseudouridine synthase [Pinibacter aurantiacus]MBV4359838.1 rRNA pseudouridine synthase [Pinibacter aurantiacus]
MGRISQFEKFINKKKAGTVKEKYKQDRKAAKKERAAAIDKHFEDKRKQKAEAYELKKAGLTASGSPKVSKEEIRALKGGNAKNPKDAKFKKTAEPVTNNTTKPGKPAGKISISKNTDVKAKAAPAAGNKDVQEEIMGNHAGMPLNKYIAHGGVCSRRDAATLVKEGKVEVNGKVVTEPGYKLGEKDVIKVNGKKVIPTKNLVYILLNKPKDYITTTDDPQGRKTVLQLIRTATEERVYPVGRLDRNTSGVLLLTNDGDLAQTLSHPSHEIKKIYEVTLDKPLTKNDFDSIAAGLTLEDGFIAPDALGYVDPKDKSIIGIEIHSGRNRIVRRIFEHLKYDVKGLDRVMYAGLTKKNVNRGKFRLLNEKEVRTLKHFNRSVKKGQK